MGLHTKTYIIKSNTLVEGSSVNLGLNPILELNCGSLVTRAIMWFDHTRLKSLVEDKTYPDIKKLRHILKLTNSASDMTVNRLNEHKCGSTFKHTRFRTCSTDLVVFKIRHPWDNGRGFSYTQDLYLENHRAYGECGSNWFQRRNGLGWEELGVYSRERLSSELEKFTSPVMTSDIVIGFVHLEYGNENLSIDLTDYVNDLILDKEENFGIGIAFTPRHEGMKFDNNVAHYIGFFGNNTNTFYEPYIETTYNSTIRDVRNRVIKGNNNRLYFYSNIGGKLQNLDEKPTVSIDGTSFEVHQETKGVYYFEHTFMEDKYEYETMYYDTWSNIKYNGRTLKDVELSFTIADDGKYFNFSNLNTVSEVKKHSVKLYGIQHNEKINKKNDNGDIRRVDVETKFEYTTQKVQNVDGMEYRLYVMTEQSEYDVIPWTEVEQGFNVNYFYINTNELIPSRYYVDIRINYGTEIIHHNKKLVFDIVNDVTNSYV